MTRSRDTADTQDNNGGSVSPFVAGKNKILNGDFGIWQRGTSGTAVFLADRFQYNSVGSDSYTQSRQTFTPGNAIAGYEPNFFHRTVITTASAYAQFSTNIESVRTFAGQTVTLSFWAKADTNTRSFGVYFDQNFGSGGSAGVSIALPSLSLTTNWVRYTASTTLPTISGKTIGTGDNLNVRLVYSGAGTFDTWGFQLEAGSVATPFTTATGNPASELAACQRYYQRVTGQFGYVATGTANNATDVLFTMPLPVQMRVAPTAINVSALADWNIIPGNKSISALTIASPKPSIGSFYVTSTGLSANQSWTLYPVGSTNGTNTWIDFSAEL